MHTFIDRARVGAGALMLALGAGACGAHERGARAAAGGVTPRVATAATRCPAGGVQVDSAERLRRALAAARPGDVIQLAAGTYLAGKAGDFTISARGRPDAPIYLCGPVDAGQPEAWLDGRKDPSVADPEHKKGASYVVHLDGAAWWRLIGFGVRNGRKGVMADHATHNVLSGLVVRATGDEAVHLRAFSTDNLVRGLVVRDTGHRRPKFGEGLYVGSAQSNWCTVSGCAPDRSDRNVLRDNDIADTTAESIDIKEGTTGGQIAGNTLSGRGMQAKGGDSWIDVKGNHWTVSDNSGTDSPNDGIQVHVILEGWGERNTITGNRLAVNGPGHEADKANVVCDNVVTGAGRGASNASCPASRRSGR